MVLSLVTQLTWSQSLIDPQGYVKQLKESNLCVINNLYHSHYCSSYISLLMTLVSLVFLCLELPRLISLSLRAWTPPVSVLGCCVWTLLGQTTASTLLALHSTLPLEVFTSSRLCQLIEAITQLSYLDQLIKIPHESNIDYWRWYLPLPH